MPTRLLREIVCTLELSRAETCMICRYVKVFLQRSIHCHKHYLLNILAISLLICGEVISDFRVVSIFCITVQGKQILQYVTIRNWSVPGSHKMLPDLLLAIKHKFPKDNITRKL